MENFPATLPAPSIDGYSINPEKSFIRTEMDTGPARQRQIFTAMPTTVSCGFKFTPAQMTEFRAFYMTDVNTGADWFRMSLDVGDGLLEYDVRFVEPWSANRLPGANWSVSANLEVRFQ